MYENSVLRRIFGPKREEVVGGRRRLHNEELHNLHVSSNSIRVMKSKRVRFAGHVARILLLLSVIIVLYFNSDFIHTINTSVYYVT
jgi:hypothetical protein